MSSLNTSSKKRKIGSTKKIAGLIFSAGLGTRLLPITNDIPKALVPVNGKPVLQWNIEKMVAAGIDRIVINIHHFADKVEEFIQSFECDAELVLIREEGEPLETGGGLKNAENAFDGYDLILAQNVDILSNISFTELVEYHEAQNPLVTLSIRKRETSRYLLFNNRYRLCGWENVSTSTKRIIREDLQFNQYGFSGIHVIDTSIFPLITQEGKFSIIETYLQLGGEYKFMGYNHSSDNWIDIGTHEKLAIANSDYQSYQ